MGHIGARRQHYEVLPVEDLRTAAPARTSNRSRTPEPLRSEPDRPEVRIRPGAGTTPQDTGRPGSR